MTQYTKSFTALLVGIAFGSLFTFVFYPAPEPETPTESVSFPANTTSGILSVNVSISDSDYLYARIPKDCVAVLELVATSSVPDAVKRFDVYCESIPNPSTP